MQASEKSKRSPITKMPLMKIYSLSLPDGVTFSLHQTWKQHQLALYTRLKVEGLFAVR